MGVRGLTSYVQRSPHSFATRADLTALANSRNEKKVRIAVDGFAFCYHICESIECEQLLLNLGGDFPSIYLAAYDFINQLIKAGVEPFFVFDGMQESEKLATSIKRRETEILKANNIFRAVRSAQRTQTGVLIPQLFIREILTTLLNEQNIFWMRSEREADRDLVNVCNSFGCIAVLSNDSDFLIFDVPGYIPFWALSFSEDSNLHAFIFTRNQLAKVLKLDPGHLSTLSCLLGNDFLDPDAWNLQTIISQRSSKRAKSKNISSRVMVDSVSSFLTSFYTGDDLELCMKLFPFRGKGTPKSHTSSQTCSNQCLKFQAALQQAKLQYEISAMPLLTNLLTEHKQSSRYYHEAQQVCCDHTFWYKIPIENPETTPAFDALAHSRLGWYALLLRDEVLGVTDQVNEPTAGRVVEYRRRRGRVVPCAVSCQDREDYQDIIIIGQLNPLLACCKIFNIEEKLTLVTGLPDNLAALAMILAISSKIMLNAASEAEGLGADEEIPFAVFGIVMTCPSQKVREYVTTKLQENEHTLSSDFKATFLQEWTRLQVVAVHVNWVLESVGLLHLRLPVLVLSTRLGLLIYTLIAGCPNKEVSRNPEILIQRRFLCDSANGKVSNSDFFGRIGTDNLTTDFDEWEKALALSIKALF